MQITISLARKTLEAAFAALIALGIAWMLRPSCNDFTGVWIGQADTDEPERFYIVSNNCRLTGNMRAGEILHEINGVSKRRWWGAKSYDIVVVRTRSDNGTQLAMTGKLTKLDKNQLDYEITATDRYDDLLPEGNRLPHYTWIRAEAVSTGNAQPNSQ